MYEEQSAEVPCLTGGETCCTGVFLYEEEYTDFSSPVECPFISPLVWLPDEPSRFLFCCCLDLVKVESFLVSPLMASFRSLSPALVEWANELLLIAKDFCERFWVWRVPPVATLVFRRAYRGRIPCRR